MRTLPRAKPGANNRTKLGNGSSDYLFVNGNTLEGRRIRELREDFGAEVGGADNLPFEGKTILRRLAHVSFELELLEAKSVSGTPIDPMAFTRLIKEQRKLRHDLHTFRPKPVTQVPFEEHLARTYGGVAE